MKTKKETAFEIHKRKQVITKFLLAENDTFATARKSGYSTSYVAAVKATITRTPNIVETFLKPFEVKGKDKKNTYTNANAVAKAEIGRPTTLKAFKSIEGKEPILSLPFTTCTMEQQIYKEFPNANFLGVEEFVSTIALMEQTIKNLKLPIKPILGKLGDVIAKCKKNSLNGAILDYTCGIGLAHPQIAMALNKNIVKVGCPIVVTVQKALRGTNTLQDSIVNEIPKGFFEDGKIAKNAIKFGAASLLGFGGSTIVGNGCELNYKIEEILEYKTKGVKSVPMVMIIIRRKF